MKFKKISTRLREIFGVEGGHMTPLDLVPSASALGDKCKICHCGWLKL
jgi:hypothetical protein